KPADRRADAEAAVGARPRRPERYRDQGQPPGQLHGDPFPSLASPTAGLTGPASVPVAGRGRVAAGAGFAPTNEGTAGERCDARRNCRPGGAGIGESPDPDGASNCQPAVRRLDSPAAADSNQWAAW